MPPTLSDGLRQAVEDALVHVLDPGVWLVRLITQSGDTVIQLLDALIFRTADPLQPGRAFTAEPTIARLVPAVQAIADLALVAAITWAFFRIMWAHGLRNQHTLRILLPRACLAALVINLAPQLVQAAVDVDNALCAVALRLTAVHDLSIARLAFAFDPSAPFLAQLTVAVLFGAYLVLALVYVIRFALLVVLTILSPAAALLFVLPETHHFARTWSSLFLSALLMQPLQLMVLGVGFSLDTHTPWTALGVPLRHLYALAAVYLAFKVPGTLNSASRIGTKVASQAKHHAEHAVEQAIKVLAKP